MPTTQKPTEKAEPVHKAAKKTTESPAKGGLRLRTAAPSLTADDLEKSLAWYSDTLGFIVKERWEDDGRLMGVELAAGDVSFYLSQDDWKKGRDRVKGEGYRLYCSTSQDVDELASQIKARGGKLLEEPHDQPWGARALTVADPDGFKVTISKE
jgi:lactoylglutathione lyase